MHTTGGLRGMKVSESLEEIRRIKERISGEIAGMSHEEIIRYFRERRPLEVGPLRRFVASDSMSGGAEPARSTGTPD